MLPLSADCVEQIGSCRGTAAAIQSGPGDWSAADDGGTSERAGRSVLRVFARTSCASGASTAIVSNTMRRQIGSCAHRFQLHAPKVRAYSESGTFPHCNFAL